MFILVSKAKNKKEIFVVMELVAQRPTHPHPLAPVRGNRQGGAGQARGQGVQGQGRAGGVQGRGLGRGGARRGRGGGQSEGHLVRGALLDRTAVEGLAV